MFETKPIDTDGLTEIFEKAAKSSSTRREFIHRSMAGIAVAGATLTAGCGKSEETQEPAHTPSMSEGVAGSEAPKSSGVTAADLEGAEKVMGINYTAAEREQMLGTIDAQIDAMRKLRALELPNTQAPAMTFDPRIPGRDYGHQDNAVILGGDEPGDLPSDESDIAFAPATHLGHWLKTGQISSADLTELYLRRIEAHKDRLECFVTVTADLARKQAAAADTEIAAGRYRGPLHGIPYGVKDLMDTEGIATTWGAMPYKDRVATRDAIVVQRLRDAGAVLVGKTTCGAIAYGDIWFGGKTRNPFNPEEGSSGSSAGSASATSAGLVGFSIGTETLGSIVSPSERCGATGLRPTFGRNARTGTMALCWSLDKIGPICRAVEDTALVLNAINGGDPSDPASLDFGFFYNGRGDISGMRVGYSPAAFEDENTNDVDRAALEALRGLGVELVEVTPPDVPVDTLFPMLIAESASAFEELTLKNLDDEMVWQAPQAWPNSWREGRFFSAVDLVNADRLRRRIMGQLDEMFTGIDAFFGPNYAQSLLTITNFTGQPQLSLRAGFMEVASRNQSDQPEEKEGGKEPEKHRVTHNVSLWAPLFQEANALAIGRRLEAVLGVAGEKPPEFA